MIEENDGGGGGPNPITKVMNRVRHVSKRGLPEIHLGC